MTCKGLRWAPRTLITVRKGDPASAKHRRLRILWLIKSLNAGGAERLLVNCARARDAERFHYEAAYLVAREDDVVPELRSAGVPVTCLDGGAEADLRWVARLRRLLRSSSFDVVHIHSPYVAAFARPVVTTLPRAVRPALVYTEHNRWPSYARATRTANRLTYGLSDATIAVSDDVRSSVSPRRRCMVTTLVHGVDVEWVQGERRHRADVRAELAVSEDEVLLGTVANLRREKAYPDLLSAAANLIAAGAPVRFVAVGQGRLDGELRRMHAALGLGDRFRFLGYRDDAVRVMSGLDVFTLSSRHEGLPVALMDALAMGLPAVCTAVGGIPEAVTDGVEGLLVPSGQPDRLAAALSRLTVDAPLRTRMAQAAAVRGSSFDIRRAVAELEQTYRDVSAARRRSAVTAGR